MSRHRGAKLPHRYELLGGISLLSPAYLLSVERRPFRTEPPDHYDLLQSLPHPGTAACVLAERALNRALAGSCQVPLGGFAEVKCGKLRLRSFVASPDGKRMTHAELTGDIVNPEALGGAVAQD